MVGLGFPTTFTTPSEAALAAKSTGSPQPRIHFLIVDVKRACALTTGSMSVMAMLRQLGEGLLIGRCKGFGAF